MNYDSFKRPSSRINRPPGGCSSNIFGDATTVTPHPVKTPNKFKSSIFASDSPQSIHNKPNTDRSASCNSDHSDGKSYFKAVDFSSKLFRTYSPECLAKGAAKPKFTSKVFNYSCAETRVRNTKKCAPQPEYHPGQLSNIPMFCSNGERPATVIPCRRKPSKALTSALFDPTNYPDNDKHSPGVSERPKTEAARRDPITGGLIDDKDEKRFEVEEIAQEEDVEKSLDSHEPRLGPIKNSSGIRCAQPPGGKSSLTID